MLNWLYTAVAWAMKQWHFLLSTFLDPVSGITWALSIVLLVVTIRVLLFPLFVTQVASQRAMQELRPELVKLKELHGADRQGYSQAVLSLQKERGVNPLAGCLPMLAQIPVFISLLHVLRRIAPDKNGLYSWDDTLTDQAARAELFGAPISSSFIVHGQADAALGMSSSTSVRVVALALIVLMCAMTFVTQRQSQRRSGPVVGQAATVQKLLLYGMPISLFVTGFFFPVGVLVYWLTNNAWTFGQQFYILRAVPPPGLSVAPTEGDADDRRIRGRAVPPRPGMKPLRPSRGGPHRAAVVDPDDAGAGGARAPRPRVQGKNR